MTDQNSDGWKVSINHRRESGIVQRIFLVAILNEAAMIDAVCEQLKLNAGMLAHFEKASAAQLEEHRVKAGDVYELMELGPRGL